MMSFGSHHTKEIFLSALQRDSIYVSSLEKVGPSEFDALVQSLQGWSKYAYVPLDHLI